MSNQSKLIRLSIKASLVLLLLAAVAAPSFSSSGWELVKSDEGIDVFSKELDDSNHLAFKAMGVIKAEWFIVLSTLADLDRADEWIERVKEMEVVSVLNEKERVIYGRFDSPWPLNDRDVVLQGKLTYDNKAGWIRLASRNVAHRAKPPLDDVVRMPLVRNQWRLRPVQNGTATYLEFQAVADPGGVIPAWVANLVSKQIPYRSIKNLRKQVAKKKVNRKVLKQIYEYTKKNNIKAAKTLIETKYKDLL